MLLARRAHRNSRVVLVADDINHRHRARGFALEAVNVPVEFRLPPETEPKDRLSLTLHNDGKGNARDVVVYIQLPMGVEELNRGFQFEGLPRVPQPFVDFSADREYYKPELVPELMQLRFEPITPSDGDDGGRFHVRDDRCQYRSTELRHRSSMTVGDLFLTFRADALPHDALELRYEAHAEGAPPSIGRLLIEFM